MATQHDGELGAGHGVAGDTCLAVRVKDNAQGALGVLVETDALRDQVAEAVVVGAVEPFGWVPQVDELDGDSFLVGEGRETVVAR